MAQSVPFSTPIPSLPLFLPWSFQGTVSIGLGLGVEVYSVQPAVSPADELVLGAYFTLSSSLKFYTQANYCFSV